MQKGLVLIIGLLLISSCYYFSGSLVYGQSSEGEPEASQGQQSLEWSTRTYQLQQAVIELGYTEYQSKLFIDICKKQEKNISARHCVEWISAVGVAESNACKIDYGYNCRGIMRGGLIVVFKNRPQAVEFWVERYYRFWWTNKTPQDWIKRSRYCITDSLGDNEIHCPNRQKNTAWVIDHFNSKKIYND